MSKERLDAAMDRATTLLAAETAQMRRLLESDVASIQKRLGAVEQRLNSMNPHCVERTLDHIEADVAQLHGHTQIMIEKITVLTECGRSVRASAPDAMPSFALGVMLAMDLDDSWWRARSRMSIRFWIDEILTVAKTAAEISAESRCARLEGCVL